VPVLNPCVGLPAVLNLSSAIVCLTCQARRVPVLNPCVVLDILSVDIFHVVYPSLRDIILSVDIFHVIYPSLRDKQFLSESIADFSAATVMNVSVNTFFVVLKSAFLSLAYVLPSDFTMFLCLLYRNLIIHAILTHHIPQEDPRNRACLTCLLIKRSAVLRHDFFAILAAFSANQLTLRNNVQRCLRSAGNQLSQIEVMYALRHSLHARFSLPWLFLLIQITSIFSMYRRPTSFSNQYEYPPSGSPLVSSSGDVQHPRCERVLTYGGGRQHEFSALDVEPYITAGDFNHDCAFKFVNHVDSLGQVAYPITQKYVHANIPLPNILPYLTVQVALKIARLHHLQIGSHVPKSEICQYFQGHNCISCNVYITVFAIVDSKA
jgi:hypothetical protein